MLADRILPITDNRMLKRLNNTINTIITNDLSYVIWVAGYTGRVVTEYICKCSEHPKRPEFTVDNNKALWGTETVKSPAEFEKDMDKIDMVLVCVYVADQVVDQLRTMGYSGEIMVVSASVFNIEDKVIQYYDEHLKDIEGTYAIVADEKSRKTIETYINVIRTGDIEL